MPSRPRPAVLAALASAVAGAVLAPSALASFPGGNGQIAFVRDGDIWAVNPDGTGEHRITSGSDVDDSPDWSPDGRELVFERRSASAPAESHVYRVRADGTGLRPVVSDGSDPDWFRDGRRIVFTRALDTPDDQRALFSVERDGSDVRRIQRGFHRSHEPDASPTRDYFLTHFIGDNADASLFATDGLGVIPWRWEDTQNPDEFTSEHETLDGSWAPDGERLAFRVDPGPGHACVGLPDPCAEDPDVGLSTMDILGEDLRNIVPEGHDPAWSPDGTRIAYVAGSPEAIHVARTDGTGRRQVTAGTQPDWQPKPARRPARGHDGSKGIIRIEVCAVPEGRLGFAARAARRLGVAVR